MATGARDVQRSLPDFIGLVHGCSMFDQNFCHFDIGVLSGGVEKRVTSPNTHLHCCTVAKGMASGLDISRIYGVQQGRVVPFDPKLADRHERKKGE